jgi:hypothetical protein
MEGCPSACPLRDRQHPGMCGRCGPPPKQARHYALRDPLPDDCPLPPQFRFAVGVTARGPYMMCDDCAREGARWFVLQEAA